ncbi:MAG: hypothetical protein JSR82_05765 [Verrucomicrobia bacterium]|nr:hypothetical protein [Verrucomicrobiota bacterium]
MKPTLTMPRELPPHRLPERQGLVYLLAFIGFGGALLFTWLGFSAGIQEAYDAMRDGDPPRPFLLLASVLIFWSIAASLIGASLATIAKVPRLWRLVPAVVPLAITGIGVWSSQPSVIIFTLPVVAVILGQASFGLTNHSGSCG